MKRTPARSRARWRMIGGCDLVLSSGERRQHEGGAILTRRARRVIGSRSSRWPAARRTLSKRIGSCRCDVPFQGCKRSALPRLSAAAARSCSARPASTSKATASATASAMTDSARLMLGQTLVTTHDSICPVDVCLRPLPVQNYSCIRVIPSLDSPLRKFFIFE